MKRNRGSVRETGQQVGSVGSAVTWGLLGAWVVHDLEELATMPGFAARKVRGLRARYPKVPERMWSALEIDRTHAATAIGAMGVLISVAAARGAWTGGRSGFYQTVLVGFGGHGLVHLAQGAAFRGYTPGLVTAPGVIAYSAWAWRKLRRAGVARSGDARDMSSYAALFPATILGAHGVAYAARRLMRRRSVPRSRKGVAPHG
jgi:hypothetical protein